MGTNYYFHPSGDRDCPHCGQRTENRHIGKSSAGWAFSLHVYPNDGITSLEDWKALWADPKGAIFDEYGDKTSVADMLAEICERSHPRGLRHHILNEWGLDARAGGKTYDLCNYEFS
jgi:hypothetical protein